MKKCPKCDTFKANESFTKSKQMSDGLNCWCKSCTRANSKRGYEKNKELRSAQVKEYRQTAKGKQIAQKAASKWVFNNPKKYICHQIVKTAIKYGVVSIGVCEICGTGDNLHAHHNDYNRPFDVEWYCVKHHRELHSGKIDRLNEERTPIYITNYQERVKDFGELPKPDKLQELKEWAGENEYKSEDRYVVDAYGLEEKIKELQQ